MSNVLFTGIMPALITPLGSNGEVLSSSVVSLLDYNYSKGASGFYICGSTGEGPVLDVKSRMRLAEDVMLHNNGRGSIICHVGAASFTDTATLARHAREIGCTAVSSVVPNFYFKYNESEIAEYYKRLYEEAQLPVVAYAQGLIGDADVVSLIKRLISDGSIIGVKYTMTNFFDMQRIKQLNGGDINVINGPDEMLICGLSMGADAGIGSTYNVMCAEYCRLFSLFGAGNLSGAMAQQEKINRIITVILRHGVIRTIKFMLSLSGIECGNAAFPASELDTQEKAAIRQELDECGFFSEYNH